MVTYTIASAGRFEPIPELVVDKVEAVMLICCGFFKKKEKRMGQNQLQRRQNEKGHTTPGGKWNPPIDGVEARFDSSLLEEEDDDIPI